MARILLRFPQSLLNEPITSRVVLESGVLVNILTANITSKGGEILAEVDSKDIDKVVYLFRRHGVTVDVQKRVDVDREACIDCGACYSICPVDAISFKPDYSVVHDYDKCVACGLCVDACPTRAIHI
ncbi:MAG: 4Fe-4S binding protein [Candidatus Bathyarchaeia archaeon]